MCLGRCDINLLLWIFYSFTNSLLLKIFNLDRLRFHLLVNSSSILSWNFDWRVLNLGQTEDTEYIKGHHISVHFELISNDCRRLLSSWFLISNAGFSTFRLLTRGETERSLCSISSTSMSLISLSYLASSRASLSITSLGTSRPFAINFSWHLFVPET